MEGLTCVLNVLLSCHDIHYAQHMAPLQSTIPAACLFRTLSASSPRLLLFLQVEGLTGALNMLPKYA
jgi:hypothetical protein